MNYTIIDKKLTCMKDGVSYYLVTLVCDTPEDVPEPDASWAAGSIAQICDPHGYKILNSEGVWK